METCDIRRGLASRGDGDTSTSHLDHLPAGSRPAVLLTMGAEFRHIAYLRANGEQRMERERFVKLLGMTSSSSDGEALVAIRKCNDMLMQHKLSWPDVVQLPQPSQRRSETNTRGDARRSDRVSRRNDHRSPTRDFVASLRRQEYFEQTLRNEKAVNLRVYIRNVPLLLRLLFFPLWAAAAMVAGIVIPEASRLVRAMKLFAVVLVTGACWAFWVQIFQGVIQTLLLP